MYDHHRNRGSGALTFGLAAVAIGAAGFALMRTLYPNPPRLPEDAPLKSWRRSRLSADAGTIVGRSVTINRDRRALYDYWRDFSHLPEFMENVLAVSVQDDKRSRWTIAGPAGTEVEFDTEITEERPGELIAWRSVGDADVQNRGRVEFRDAAAGRGTIVDATIEYEAPGGRAGELIAKLFQREPNVQARRELKRFKQLMETGEIAVAEAGAAAPRGEG